MPSLLSGLTPVRGPTACMTAFASIHGVSQKNAPNLGAGSKICPGGTCALKNQISHFITAGSFYIRERAWTTAKELITICFRADSIS